MIAEEFPMTSGEHACTPTERKSTRRYIVEVGTASTLYVVLLLVSLHFVDGASGAAKVALALLPMAGILATVVALVRFALRADEFVRQTIFVSGAIAALASGVVAIGLGFLENAGMPPVGIGFGWPLIAVTFAIAFPFVRRSYR